jgi:hypothetical protein
MTADRNWSLVASTPMGERRGSLSLKTEETTVEGSQMTQGKFDRNFSTALSMQRNLPEGINHRSNANDSRISLTEFLAHLETGATQQVPCRWRSDHDESQG